MKRPKLHPYQQDFLDHLDKVLDGKLFKEGNVFGDPGPIFAFVDRAAHDAFTDAHATVRAAAEYVQRTGKKNGFVGRMPPVYGQRVMPMVLSLKSTEWRRL